MSELIVLNLICASSDRVLRLAFPRQHQHPSNSVPQLSFALKHFPSDRILQLDFSFQLQHSDLVLQLRRYPLQDHPLDGVFQLTRPLNRNSRSEGI